MTKVVNNENRFSGEYMVQDQDHMGESQPSRNVGRGDAQQVDQSQSSGPQQSGHQQVGDQHTSGQQGGGRRRKML